tara:strand:+ start:5375 stop:5707 length:333 start_codon:yes stop_codon:yes gene_type:complete
MEQFATFLPLILIFLVFWILLIRPQQKKMKQHREMVTNLKRGDKVVTSGGLMGEIIKVNENKEITLEISDNVKVQIAAGMISELLSKTSDQSNNPLQENKKGSFLSKLKK